MSATNFSMIWAQLASPLQASGMIPFVDTDSASITGDVLNFNYDKVGLKVFVANGVAVNMVDKSAVAGAATINRSAGRNKIAAAATVLVVTNNLAAVGDIVEVNLETADATLNRLLGIATAGTITFTGNAAATAAVTFSWMLNKVVAVAA